MTKILFLEDEEVIREILCDYLRQSNYEVVEASDGRKALSLLSEDIDVAILDIMVPKVSGINVLKHIKENYNNINVIMLSALDDIETQVSAFDLKCDDYIVKPINPLLLLKRVEMVLRRADVIKSNNIGLRLDSDAYTAVFDGKELSLTISEFLILKLLFNNKNRAFNREQIILYVYNDEYLGNDRIIDSHIKNLRKKLPINCIKTVVGIGYKYQEQVNEIKS